MTTAPPASPVATLMSPLQVTCGGVVSETVTVNVQLLVRFELSVAVHTTLLTPKRKPVPDGGVQITGNGLLSASTAVTVKVTGVRPPAHSTEMSPLGHVNVGAGLNLTVTSKWQELGLPTESVAVQVTVVVPTGNVPPDGGEQTRVPIPHASKAEAE